jgi:hypothetical protein
MPEPMHNTTFIPGLDAALKSTISLPFCPTISSVFASGDFALAECL